MKTVLTCFVTRAIFPAMLILPCFAQAAQSGAPSISSQKLAIQKLYMAYLNVDHSKPVPDALVNAGEKLFSDVLKDMIKLDLDLCLAKFPDQICGWSADGDAFLNTQDVPADLTFAKSGFTIVEVAGAKANQAVLEVNFNISPNASGHKTIQFVNSLQNGKWVISDIIYVEKQSPRSTVENLKNEIFAVLSK